MELPSTQTSGSKRPPGSSIAKPNPHTEAPSAPEPPKVVKVHNIHIIFFMNTQILYI